MGNMGRVSWDFRCLGGVRPVQITHRTYSVHNKLRLTSVKRRLGHRLDPSITSAATCVTSINPHPHPIQQSHSTHDPSNRVNFSAEKFTYKFVCQGKYFCSEKCEQVIGKILSEENVYFGLYYEKPFKI